MLWLMFPAYNEKENLVKLLPEMFAFLENKIKNYKILIIDDGSTDSTKNIKKHLDEALPVRIISHEKNLGIGEVFKTGLSAINKESDEGDFLIVLEADGTSDYTLIPKLIDKLQSGSDVVIASRYMKGGAYRNFPLKRHLLSFFGNKILRLAFPNRNIKDYTIFFRGYKVGVIKRAISEYKNDFITSKTFLANTEVLIKLAKITKNISEVPFVYSYGSKIGKSKMPILKTLLDHIRFMIIHGF